MNKKTNIILFGFFITVFGLAFSRVYLRVQTIKTGYHIGELKKQEAFLLEERSRLQMELAKLTTRKSLRRLAK